MATSSRWKNIDDKFYLRSVCREQLKEQYSLGKPNVTKISGNFNKKISINHLYQYVISVTSSGDGNIVISGNTSDATGTFIIVIDMNGRILKQKVEKIFDPFRNCQFLSQHKVATVGHRNEIGLYDARDGSYIKKNISDVISSWPKYRYVDRVATDPVNNHILVNSSSSRNVYVFDNQLNYLHILTLPEMIKRPVDMTVSNGHLIVCDVEGANCYVTTMDGMESKLTGEFIKPNIAGINNFGPRSVCSDKNGFIYLLWMSSRQCYLSQYNHDGSRVLTTRELGVNTGGVDVVETSQGEKLIVQTAESFTTVLHLYDLMTDD